MKKRILKDAASRVIERVINLLAVIMAASQIKEVCLRNAALLDKRSDKEVAEAAAEYYRLGDYAQGDEELGRLATLRKERRFLKDAAARADIWGGPAWAMYDALLGVLCRPVWPKALRIPEAENGPTAWAQAADTAREFLVGLKGHKDDLGDDARVLKGALAEVEKALANGGRALRSKTRRAAALAAIRAASPWELDWGGVGPGAVQWAVERLQSQLREELQKTETAMACLKAVSGADEGFVRLLLDNKEENEAKGRTYNAHELGALYAPGGVNKMPPFVASAAREAIRGAARTGLLCRDAHGLANAFAAMAAQGGPDAEEALRASEVAKIFRRAWPIWAGTFKTKGADGAPLVENKWIPGIRDTLFYQGTALPWLLPEEPEPRDLDPAEFLREAGEVLAFLERRGRLKKRIRPERGEDPAGPEISHLNGARIDVMHALECEWGRWEERREVFLSAYLWAPEEIEAARESLDSLAFTGKRLREELEAALTIK